MSSFSKCFSSSLYYFIIKLSYFCYSNTMTLVNYTKFMWKTKRQSAWPLDSHFFVIKLTFSTPFFFKSLWLSVFRLILTRTIKYWSFKYHFSTKDFNKIICVGEEPAYDLPLFLIAWHYFCLLFRLYRWRFI